MRAVEIRTWGFFWIIVCGISVSTAFVDGSTGAFVRLAFIDLNHLYPEPAPRRPRRQAYPPNPAPYQPRVEDYNLPPHYQERMWNGAGGLRLGRANTRVGFGALGRPTNTFGITPETIETLASDELFNKAREKIPSIPVSVLPGNFVPLRCKPPFCNPFLHNTAFGVDVEPGDDILVDGGLDFPLPLAPGGVGVRIPVSGGVSAGTDPLLITYGHGLGPVEPPNFKSGSDRRKSRFLPARQATAKQS